MYYFLIVFLFDFFFFILFISNHIVKQLIIVDSIFSLISHVLRFKIKLNGQVMHKIILLYFIFNYIKTILKLYYNYIKSIFIITSKETDSIFLIFTVYRQLWGKIFIINIFILLQNHFYGKKYFRLFFLQSKK